MNSQQWRFSHKKCLRAPGLKLLRIQLLQFLYCDRGTLNLLGPSGRDSICSAPAFRAGLLYVESLQLCYELLLYNSQTLSQRELTFQGHEGPRLQCPKRSEGATNELFELLTRQLDPEAVFVQASTSPSPDHYPDKVLRQFAPPKSDIEVEVLGIVAFPPKLNKTLNIALVCGKLVPNTELKSVMKKSAN